jgi:single-strand DNA-binding protein
MAEGLNRVMLLGNLGADPELRTTSGGQSVLKLRLATTESYLDRDKNRKERTEWHSCVVWGKRAEGLAKCLQKGSRLFVEGSIHTSSYDDKEGVKRYRTEVNANNIILCDGKRDGAGTAASRPEPRSNYATPGEEAAMNEEGGASDDDFPFD